MTKSLKTAFLYNILILNRLRFRWSDIGTVEYTSTAGQCLPRRPARPAPPPGALALGCLSRRRAPRAAATLLGGRTQWEEVGGGRGDGVHWGGPTSLAGRGRDLPPQLALAQAGLGSPLPGPSPGAGMGPTGFQEGGRAGGTPARLRLRDAWHAAPSRGVNTLGAPRGSCHPCEGHLSSLL